MRDPSWIPSVSLFIGRLPVIEAHPRLACFSNLKNAAGIYAMPTSTSNIFCRVNRRRPCRICGKPDWCIYYVRDETLSVCMRVSEGAHKINRHGVAIFIHGDWREETLFQEHPFVAI
jgi:hypothetical protein